MYRQNSSYAANSTLAQRVERCLRLAVLGAQTAPAASRSVQSLVNDKTVVILWHLPVGDVKLFGRGSSDRDMCWTAVVDSVDESGSIELGELPTNCPTETLIYWLREVTADHAVTAN
jgi:hypothetical protein